jgi:hypothetical protein
LEQSKNLRTRTLVFSSRFGDNEEGFKHCHLVVVIIKVVVVIVKVVVVGRLRRRMVIDCVVLGRNDLFRLK